MGGILARSNYQQIQSLAYDQHEIATETISLQQGLQDKGYEEWVGEMVGNVSFQIHLGAEFNTSKLKFVKIS